jgi:hypothetical protein
MADNIGYTPGTGATVAADEIGGVLYQRMKIGIGADGTATDLSTSNPMPANLTAPIAVSSTTGTVTTQETGELLEAIEALRMAVVSLTKTIGMTLPDTTGRMRVNIETGSNVAITSLPTLATVTTVGTVTTVATTTNQTQMGGIPAIEQVPALMSMAAKELRNNITVT